MLDERESLLPHEQDGWDTKQLGSIFSIAQAPLRSPQLFICLETSSMAGSLPPQSFSDYLEAGHQLIVTTPADIQSWSLSGGQTIFHSDSSSILSAKRIVNHGNLVAVSDKQGILLYDLDTATTNSYKLKGTKARS
jgi:hypothetical protein